jgi:hypothetical protein
MAFITEQLIGEKCIQLGHEEIARGMSFGTDWIKIRVGIRMWMLPGITMASIGGLSNTLAVGISQGTSNLFYSNDTTDYMAIALGQPRSAITYSTNGISSSEYTYPAASGAYYMIKTGNTVASGAAYSISSTAHVGAGKNIRSAIYIDFIKTSFGYYLVTAYTNQTSVSDLPRSTFLFYMENEGTITGQQSSCGQAQIPYTGAGLYNSVGVLWSRCYPAVEISDICVTRFL